MQGKSGFKRLFMVFESEDRGFSDGGDPSGYLKIEARGGKIKVRASVNNLQYHKEEYIFKLYLIDYTEKDIQYRCIGPIEIKNRKGELVREVDGEELQVSFLDEYNIAALVAEYKDSNKGIACPLVYYKEGRLPFKAALDKELSRGERKALVLNEIRKEEKPPEKIKQKQEQIKKDIESETRQDFISQYNFDIDSKYEKKEDNKNDIEESIEESLQNKDEAKADTTQDKKETKTQEEGNKEKSEKKSNLFEDYEKFMDEGVYPDKMKSEGNEDDCLYSDDGYCNFNVGSGNNIPCNNCFAKVKQSPDFKNKGRGQDMEAFKQGLDKYFVRSNPFKSRRKDYKWWKIASPVHLNNLLYSCGLKTPMIFNPKVMMAYFKYRHLIMGIYSDVLRTREYIVFGVPGVFSIDEDPFDQMSRWVQMEGRRPRYGAFGYWLIYIEPKLGKILSVGR